MNILNRPLNILHVTRVSETSMPYNEHCLSLADKRHITICTYFISRTRPSAEITLFEGDNSLRGFFRALRAALAAREYDVIHVHAPHTAVLLPLATVLYGVYRRLLPSMVVTVHNSYQSFRFRHRLMLISAFAFFQRVVCCSQASLGSFPVLYKWLAGSRLCAIQNGVDLDRIDRILGNKPHKASNGQFTVMTVGRLIRIKNLLTVLNAFQRGADPAGRLVFIGEGNLGEELFTKTIESGLEKQVEFTGLISRDKVYEKLARAALFISASRGEGLPVAALEAMACRCPVILSDIPPHREIAAGAGFIPLIPPDDVAGFTREITQFQRLPEAERIAIGEKCRTWVKERFSLKSMHEKYMELYMQMLDYETRA